MADISGAPTPLTAALLPTGELTILDLPRETQENIFAHCSNNDLVCLSLVSRHFRELAAAQLYRTFHIVFPDEDDPNFYSPIDGLAGGLETFTTSEYDYARHLKDISLDTLSGGHKAEVAYKPFLYSASCGKFMNTLLLLTLRKAKSLESFKWNIRVELSRPVYKALHQVQTLRHLQIRLQAGMSLYEPPPPLPLMPSDDAMSNSSSASHLPDIILPPPPAPPALPALTTLVNPSAPSIFYVPPSTTIPHYPPPKPPTKPRIPRRFPSAAEPPTLSGFKNLKTLAVLDIDSLHVVEELRTCVRNSAGTLTKLKISFSDSLASQARKPPPDADPEDSDPDDELVLPAIGGSSWNDHEASGPAKAFRAQEEKKVQEGILGRILDAEPSGPKKSLRKTRDKDKQMGKDSDAKDKKLDPGAEFVDALKNVASKLMRELHGWSSPSAAQQEILDVIEAASRKYVAAEETKSNAATGPAGQKDETAAPSQQNAAEGTDNAGTVASSSTIAGKKEESPAAKAAKQGDAKNDVGPEDIDIAEPEEQLDLQDIGAKDNTPQSVPQTDGQASSSAAGCDDTATPPEQESSAPRSDTEQLISRLQASKVRMRALEEKLRFCQAKAADLDKQGKKMTVQAATATNLHTITTASQALSELNLQTRAVQGQIEDIQLELQELERETARLSINDSAPTPDVDSDDNTRRKMTEYLCATRGMAVETLGISLVPVKASVLSRAIDLRSLRRLTLLNVGAQAPIWALLSRENAMQPLPLREMFSDNVSMPLLTLASQLEKLFQLFLIERDAKHKPESFAMPTTTTIEQIRKLVLRKHAPTLRRVMLRNARDTAWDADDKTVLLLCRRAKMLRELSVNMGIRTMHILMQNIAGFKELQALHIISLRNDDTCVWVMRETRKFLIDNLAHHPEMKLEWVSIDDDDRAERILRVKKPALKPKDAAGKRSAKQSGANKGKGTAYPGVGAPGSTSGGVPGGVFPILPTYGDWDVNSASSDEEDYEDEDADNNRWNGKLMVTQENHSFCDIYGIRIFKKEVTAGRL